METYDYLQNLLPSDKISAQMKNKISARLYIYFPDGEISNKKQSSMEAAGDIFPQNDDYEEFLNALNVIDRIYWKGRRR